MKHNETPALTGHVTFSSYRPSLKAAIRREGGTYIVSTYEGGRCVKRDPVDTHEQAWRLARSIREGVAL